VTKFKNFLFWIFLYTIFFSCTSKSTEQVKTESNIDSRSIGIEQQSVQQIFLVRHAEKSKDDPKDPNLTKAGKERAERLKFHLANAGITHIYTTDYRRTKQTILPLAEYLGIEPILYNPDLVNVTEILKKPYDGNIVIAGHSNTTPKLVNRLLGIEKYKSLDESIYDRLFLVTKVGDKFNATMLKY